ncbi:MAG: NAD(P)-binding protein [Bdellovibrionales bacterium]|nr:NAD(P)-binding protein [Bdellovibrionales bacterium]
MKTPQKFDVIVIGAGLGGLLTAKALKAAGKTVLVLEAEERIGGSLRGTATPYGNFEYGLKSLPDLAETHAALETLNQSLNPTLSVTAEKIDVAPVTYQKAEFHPFVGFGEHAPNSVEEFNYYTRPQRLALSSQPSAWVQVLAEELGTTIQTKSQVTRLKIENHLVQEVVVNGDESYQASEFVFAGRAKDLSALLAKGSIPPKHFHKLESYHGWSSVSLDLIHSKHVTDSKSLYVLSGGTQEIHACIGFFDPAIEKDGKTVQHSQWLTFVPDESAHEEELTGHSLREIRRQLKRAFGESVLESLLFERILVAPHSHGSLTMKVHNQALVELPNLKFCCPALDDQKNLVAVIRQSQKAIAAILHPQTKAEAKKKVASQAAQSEDVHI